MPFDITRPFHVGYMVENVDTAMAQLSASTGITWHPPQVFPLDIMVGDQRQSFDSRFTYSVEGPVQIELVQGPAGTLFDTSLHGGGPNHNGYWTDDLAGDIDRLVASGGELVFYGLGDAPGPQGFAMVDVAGARIELIDSVMLPMFETWYRTGSFS